VKNKKQTMKKYLSLFSVFILLATSPSLLLLPPLVTVLAGCSGCAGKGTYNPSTGVYDTAADADKLIVAAEKTGKIAGSTFAKFMQYERENETYLATKSEAIHKLAEQVRAHGETWISDLDKAKVAYQSNRGSAESKTNLQQILAVVQSILASVFEYSPQEKK
jgi:hypothetical protein